MSKAGAGIIKALDEVLAHARGEATGIRIHTPEDINAKRIRRKQRMTQKEFAAAYEIDLATLRNWEQGRRYPEGPAATLLRIIDREPAAARRALMARKSKKVMRKASA